MPLDPSLAAWLSASFTPPDELGVAEARRVIDEGAIALFGELEQVAAVEAEQEEGVPVRIYRMDGDDEGALLWFHGGGWVIGSLASHDPLCRALAARSRRTVVAVDYRLAPEHVHPAALEDCWTVTKWASRRFGRVAVGGDSAGGHLAAVVAVRARDSQLPLALQILIVPVTDCAFDTASYADNAVGVGLERKTMRWFWEQYVPQLAAADDPEVSPLRTPDLTGVAPALVVTAEYDPLRDEGEAYAARLLAAGVAVEHIRYDGMIHGFLRMPTVSPRANDALDRIAARARRVLD
jgi:acetyl esterase/lipase